MPGDSARFADADACAEHEVKQILQIAVDCALIRGDLLSETPYFVQLQRTCLLGRDDYCFGFPNGIVVYDIQPYRKTEHPADNAPDYLCV